MSKSKKNKAAVAVAEGSEFEGMAVEVQATEAKVEAVAPKPPKKPGKRKAAPTVEQEAATAAPAEQVATEPEAAPEAAETPAADAYRRTLYWLKEAFLAHLETEGHTPLTRSSYGRDLDIALDYFRPEALVASLGEASVEAFNESDGVTMKPNGQPKAKPTILKTQRVLRLALAWSRTQRQPVEGVA